MRIFLNQSYLQTKTTQNQKLQSFNGRGKPIDLRYVYQKHQKILPERVLNEVKTIISKNPRELPSLMQVHKDIYAPLLDCENMEQVKALFPEFAGVNDTKISYHKRSFKTENPKLDIRKNFALTMLQEFWAKLRSQDEIAKDFGLGSRSTLLWALEKIGFVGFPKNYKTILKSSDEEGNKIIASKTTAWNALHPDLMYARNKHAAQSNKKPEYRARQSQIIKEYDKKHPERIEKISRFGKLTWEKCPEVAHQMAIFAKQESVFTKIVIKKDMKGYKLTEKENRVKKSFYKRFWAAYPDMQEAYQNARKAAAAELRASRKK